MLQEIATTMSLYVFAWALVFCDKDACYMSCSSCGNEGWKDALRVKLKNATKKLPASLFFLTKLIIVRRHNHFCMCSVARLKKIEAVPSGICFEPNTRAL